MYRIYEVICRSGQHKVYELVGGAQHLSTAIGQVFESVQEKLDEANYLQFDFEFSIIDVDEEVQTRTEIGSVVFSRRLTDREKADGKTLD